MNDESDIKKLVAQVSGEEPEALRRYLTVARPGPYLTGSTVRPLVPQFGMLNSGIAVPTTFDPDMEYVATFLTLGEYLFVEPAEPVAVQQLESELLTKLGREMVPVDALVSLAVINRLCFERDEEQAFIANFRAVLKEDARDRFDAVMKSDPQDRVFLARQPTLFAMRSILQQSPDYEPTHSLPPWLTATLMSHAAAGGLGWDTESDAPDEQTRRTVDMLRNGLFNATEDTYALLDRTIRLWREFGPATVKFKLHASPCELLKEATGIELEDMLALAFALCTQVMKWKSDGYGLPVRFKTGMEDAKVDAFVSAIAATVDELRTSLTAATSPWDFLAFERKPVLVHNEALFVLDVGLLLARVTSGLYWYVFDYLKDKPEFKKTNEHMKWSQVYGEMVELMVEDQLRTMAPPVIGGGAREREFYTGADFKRAYPEKQRPDAAIHFGGDFALFEVVGHRLSVPSRIDGAFAAVADDTRMMVLEKSEQLDVGGKCVVTNQEPLTGFPWPEGARVIPSIVTAGAYPVNFLTMRYVDSVLAGANRFLHGPYEPLCLVDLGELEMLEGLAEKGHTPAEVLKAWKASSYRNNPLRNFIMREYGSGPDIRPSRMRAMDVVFKDMIQRLKLPED